MCKVSRRRFLQAAGVAAATAAGSGRAAARPAGRAGGRWTQVADDVFVFSSAVNVGLVRDGDRALLIDCGDAEVLGALPELGVRRVAHVLLTHAHRDQCCGAPRLAAAGAAIAAPAGARSLLERPADYWNDDANCWRVYRSFRPDHLTSVTPIPVARELADGDEIRFGGATVRALATPGHTEHSLSYVVEAGGRRTVFCGDCMTGDGRLWDVFSLQKGFSRGGRAIGGYHGFMGDRWRLADSLRKIQAAAPHLVVSAHGELTRRPAEAIDRLTDQLDRCYENYVAISALRHYFPELFREYEGRPGQMPIRPGFAPPECLRHIGTTWMLVSESRAALVMDVGSPRVVPAINAMLAKGEIRSVDGLWVTHYHHDHTQNIAEFQREFDCPCYADRRLADVLTRPRAWRLPCLIADPVRVDHALEDGHAWRWREFQLTSYFYPGQTLYHGALLAERGPLRMLFIGDSHTMAGIDDYCAYNRNFLGRGVGFQYCLSLLEKLRPTHLFNCHVAEAFRFTDEEIRFMRRNLDEREKRFGELIAWEHPNYGLDPSWTRCDPYWQAAKAGSTADVEVVVTNHSDRPRRARCRFSPLSPAGRWSSGWAEAEIPPKGEGRVRLSLPLPAGLRPGRRVAPVDVEYAGRRLIQWAEAMVDVTG